MTIESQLSTLIESVNNLNAQTQNLVDGQKENKCGIAIYGPVKVPQGETAIYKITNYDSFTTYLIQVTNGEVNLVGDSIVFVAPLTTDVVLLTVNDRIFELTVFDPLLIDPGDGSSNGMVDTPMITSPITGSTDQPMVLSITASAYSSPLAGITHESTDWQISTNSTFTAIVDESLLDTVNLTSWENTLQLQPLTTYYIRVKYHGISGNVSNWSVVTLIVTKATALLSANIGYLTSSDTQSGDGFGEVVAMSADQSLIAISANLHNHNSNLGESAVYLFTPTSGVYSESNEVLAVAAETLPNGDIRDISGGAMAITLSPNGSLMALGQPNKGYSSSVIYGNLPVANVGFIQIYPVTAGVAGAVTTLELGVFPGFNTNDSYSYEFGKSVDMNNAGDLLVASASGHQYNSGAGATTITIKGSLYLAHYDGTNWAIVSDTYLMAIEGLDKCVLNGAGSEIYVSQINPLTSYHNKIAILAIDPANYNLAITGYLNPGTYSSGDDFGCSIDISKTAAQPTLIAGAQYDSRSGYVGSGAAYIFEYDGVAWNETRLSPLDPVNNGNYGHTVKMSADGTVALVYAENSMEYPSQGYGIIYPYFKYMGKWIRRTPIVLTSEAQNLNLGITMGLNSDGSWGVFGSTLAMGRAYIFH